MARLAVAGEPSLEASDTELRRGGLSYTVDTLEAFAAETPQAELFFIIGADSLPELKSWRRLSRILELARLVVVVRPGYSTEIPAEDFPAISTGTLKRIEEDRVRMEPCGISSSRIREAIRAGKTIEGLVPPAVADYIEERGLYR
jgi:nicotinate-nucleotide adenylyltransferase